MCRSMSSCADCPSFKEKGDYITAKNTEDGVAKAIYKFLKI